MSATGLGGLVREVREGLQAARGELSAAEVGPVVVSGILAAQLARELGAGAAPGAVVVGGPTPRSDAEALIRIVAGDPTPEDDGLIRAADRDEIPVVIVQTWPQAEWAPPYARTPFVVECRTGAGFPMREIAERIFEASERAPALAARIPVLSDAVADGLVRQTALRAALLSLGGKPARGLIALDQIRMLSRLHVSSIDPRTHDELPVVAGGVGAVLASGFLLREAARAARGVLPAPLVDAAIAAGGTWALAVALRKLEQLRADAA